MRFVIFAALVLTTVSCLTISSSTQAAKPKMTSPHLTSLEANGWMIDDGEVAHAESPDSYSIPPLAERQSLEPGAYVKIRFYIRAPDESGNLVDHGERMWVQVKERRGNWYLGELDNDPYCCDAIQAGMSLWFQARHVIAIDRG